MKEYIHNYFRMVMFKMLSVKLARELKEAGLTWSPKVGDWFVTRLSPTWWLKSKKSGEEELYLLTGQPTENGYYGWSMVDTEPFCELFTHDGTRQEENWEHLDKNFIWLPRLDQLAGELSLRARSFHILFKGPGGDPPERTGYWVAYAAGESKNEEPPTFKDFYSETPEEAMGIALLSLMQKVKP